MDALDGISFLSVRVSYELLIPFNPTIVQISLRPAARKAGRTLSRRVYRVRQKVYLGCVNSTLRLETGVTQSITHFFGHFDVCSCVTLARNAFRKDSVKCTRTRYVKRKRLTLWPEVIEGTTNGAVFIALP